MGRETSRYRVGSAECRNALEEELWRVYSRQDGRESLERESSRVVNARLRGIEVLLDIIAKKLLVENMVDRGLEPRPQRYEQDVNLPVYQQPLE